MVQSSVLQALIGEMRRKKGQVCKLGYIFKLKLIEFDRLSLEGQLHMYHRHLGSGMPP